jgi:hypothetical protein
MYRWYRLLKCATLPLSLKAATNSLSAVLVDMLRKKFKPVLKKQFLFFGYKQLNLLHLHWQSKSQFLSGTLQQLNVVWHYLCFAIKNITPLRGY